MILFHLLTLPKVLENPSSKKHPSKRYQAVIHEDMTVKPDATHSIARKKMEKE